MTPGEKLKDYCLDLQEGLAALRQAHHQMQIYQNARPELFSPEIVTAGETMLKALEEKANTLTATPLESLTPEATKELTESAVNYNQLYLWHIPKLPNPLPDGYEEYNRQVHTAKNKLMFNVRGPIENIGQIRIPERGGRVVQ